MDEISRIALERDSVAKDHEVKSLTLQHITNLPDPNVNLVADLNDQIRSCEQRLTEIREREQALRETLLDEDEISQTLREFEPMWDSLATREKSRILQLLIEHVEYDSAEDTIAELKRGTELQVRHLMNRFRCSSATAKRDLTALKTVGLVRFVGSARVGRTS